MPRDGHARTSSVPLRPSPSSSVVFLSPWPGRGTTADGQLAQPLAQLSWFGTLIVGKTDGSGLQYLRNRYYDPRTGRFTQEDPIGLAGGVNLYGFAEGDPVNFSDPFGLCASGAGGSGGDGGDGGGASQQQQEPKTECEQLADRAGQIAGSVESVGDFAEQFGNQIAGVSRFATLRAGGRNAITAGVGGYRDQFGGNARGQARHFAASAWAMNRYGRFAADYMFAVNETYPAGANAQDYNLSVAAFDMLDVLKKGSLKLGEVGSWILRTLCKPGGQ